LAVTATQFNSVDLEVCIKILRACGLYFWSTYSDSVLLALGLSYSQLSLASGEQTTPFAPSVPPPMVLERWYRTHWDTCLIMLYHYCVKCPVAFSPYYI